MEHTSDISVEVTVSAVAERIALIRHVVGDVLDDAGIMPSNALDMVLAVDAMCTLIVPCSADSRSLTCAVAVGSAATDASVHGWLVDDVHLPHGGFSWRLLEQTVGGVDVVTGHDGWVQIACRKPHVPVS
ncbi:hypothetical protein V1Y59_10795 [Gordonia sp. PKS22-38]|uniref:Serine/threonine-protein kinase RsbW n=1 Tax=Gordonia prachuapensis TaxID=3115651 RepID=A0ABU7MTA5_9ACTN|nr:hypothetical protein [Gordonia sp. PKS22-38]